MKRKRIALAAALSVAGLTHAAMAEAHPAQCFTPPAVPVSQPIAVINAAGVPASRLACIENDAQWEVNGPVHRAYPAAPSISFTSTIAPGDWLVEILPASRWPQDERGNLGYHWTNTTFTVAPSAPTPSAEVEWPPEGPMRCESFVCVGFEQPSIGITFAHEVIEMTVDPTGTGREICDPVSYLSWRRNAARVIAFTRPNGTVWKYRR
jgi:hypothetical protein